MSGTSTGRLSLLAALIAALVSPLAVGQTTTTAPTTTTTATGTGTTTTTTTAQPATATNPESKLVAQFTDLAGSKENATSLVSGLRSGSAITLNSPTTTTGTTGTTTTPTAGTSSTFTAPTKPMGYGNIRIALSLARTQLASQGITNPTPTQLQGALVGTSGPSGTQTGILQMRADGMGWGKIANTMGVKLGAVMSGKQTWPAAGTTTTASGTTTTATGASGKSSGITTADGASGKHSGITTAAGGSSQGGGITTGMGQMHGGGMAYGAGRGGAVNAAGGQAGGMGGGGHANGGGKH